MARIGSSQLAFPDFRGATRRIVLANLAAYFLLLFFGHIFRDRILDIQLNLSFIPSYLLDGKLWQPITYSFVHVGIFSTFLELLSLWFLAGFLETMGHRSSWVMGLFVTAILATAVAALALYGILAVFGSSLRQTPIAGTFGAIFAMLAVIGVRYGEMQFMLFPLPIGIKAKYLAIIYTLIAVATLFTSQGIYAFAQLGGGLSGLILLGRAPSRGFGFTLSEKWYGLRNRYYRWKRRRAARKFEVYMKSQGRTVHFDGQGRPIDDDPNDKKRWN
ncbi:MAG: rhomboid family intramembrane serine protease [Terracidiphilus sp.]